MYPAISEDKRWIRACDGEYVSRDRFFLLTKDTNKWVLTFLKNGQNLAFDSTTKARKWVDSHCWNRQICLF